MAIHPSNYDQHAFVLAGLPGSGKSTAGEIIQESTKQRMHLSRLKEVSDFVRDYFEDRGWDGDDNELGRVAAEKKEEEGNHFFVKKLAEKYRNPDDTHIIISGVRSPAEAEAVEDVYGKHNTTTIAIWTLPDIRFERKYGAVPNTDHPKWDEFQERNEREIHEWRCIEFFTGRADYVVTNNADIPTLRAKLDSIVKEELFTGRGGATELKGSPFPDNADGIVAQYL